MKKIMIIGVGWEQIPLVDVAKRMGYYVVATTRWKKSKVKADVVYEVDSRNIEEIERIYLKEIPDAITADECDYSVYAVAYLTEKYNMPGPRLEQLGITNNKYLQRKILVDKRITSVNQPEFALCWNYVQAVEEAEKISFPVIIKPVDNRGSIGVIKACNKEELKDAWYKAIVNAHSRMCIVEKYIEGNTITAEGFHDSSKFNFITVSTKDTYKENKNVAKVLYYPGKLSQEQIDKIKNYVLDIVTAYGIDFGFTHFEFLIEEKTGDIYFIEAANRGGGVYISNKILKELTNIDLVESMILMALGKKVILDDIKVKHNVIMYFFEPLGKSTPNTIINNNDNIIAMHINESNNNIQSNKDDARARMAVVLLRGDNPDKLLIQAKKIEDEMTKCDSEFIYGA